MIARAGATLAKLAVLVGLCALPARGEQVLPTQVLYTFTSIDTVPTKKELEDVLGNPTPPEALSTLVGYIKDDRLDFGMRLRAIRALPHFCPEKDECRNEILSVLGEPTGKTPGQKLLLQRAAIEALAAARTGNPDDVDRLVAYLVNPSRDLQVAAIRALRDLCDPAAIRPLQDLRREATAVAQVQRALDEALAVLAQCGP